MVDTEHDDSLDAALHRLRSQVPVLAERLLPEQAEEAARFVSVMDGKVLPRFHPELPLVVAVCGGGSSGKSTLFNAVVGKAVSPTGGRAGMNRRLLLGIHPRHLRRSPDMLENLFAPFGVVPEDFSSSEALTDTGPPTRIALESVPEGLMVVDTPDFDTGAAGAYTNRAVAEQALDVADVLVYTFTNANYNNRDNTDFVARMLTGIGRRKCFLVYRVYPSFRAEEVDEHAAVVARNLYGDAAREMVLGVFRVDEDNAVAAGRKPPAIQPVHEGRPGLVQALQEIDAPALRWELHRSVLSDALASARMLSDHAERSCDWLALYLDALRTLQSQCAQEALRHFPMDRVVRRFAEIWMNTDPVHIRFMRKTGTVIEWPLKQVFGAVRKIASGSDNREALADPESYTEKLGADLIAALNRLHTQLISPALSVTAPGDDPAVRRMKEALQRLGGPAPEKGSVMVRDQDHPGWVEVQVPLHPSLVERQEALRRREWASLLADVVSRKGEILSISEGVERELLAVAERFRKRMGTWDKLRQSFSAFLNVLPATAAVTYVLSTGDPIGATGIKVKLTGLFGLNDLYALIAIPATSGVKKADQAQLERLLGPIAKAWLDDKLRTVRDLFETEVTGPVLAEAGHNLEDSRLRIDDVRRCLELAAAREPVR
jgi:hypothetical protein